MWKVLIADDEEIIREGIRETVNWDKFQMEVVAEAEDGEEALELALKHGIHVLFVDLSMPIMDGITLMKHIRQKLPDCRMIVVTGHDEFAYAQEALRLQADDYILKPTNPEQLHEVISKVKKELEREREQKRYVELLSSQIQKNLPLLRQQFCLAWVAGEMTETEIMKQLQLLQLPSSCPSQVAIVYWSEFFANQPVMNERDKQLFLFAIENIISELLDIYEKVVFRDQFGLIVLCIWSHVTEEMWMRLEESVKKYLNVKVNIYTETVKGSLMQVADAYQQCKTKIYNESHISPIVRRAKQYIQEHFSEPGLTLESVAQSLNVSPVYLSRIIKQELGTSFVSLLTKARIKKAIELLTSTDLSIHEISERVGYDTQHYFSTAFKKVVGVSPNQYRKGASLPNSMRKHH